MIKKLLRSILSAINCIIPKRNKILLYSGLGYRDNIKALGDYLVDNQYYINYKIFIDKNDKFKDDINLSKYFRKFKNNKILRLYHFLTSKYIFYAFGSISVKPSKKQSVIQMWHGTPLKKIGNLINNRKTQSFYFTHLLASSEYFRKIMSKAFACPITNVVVCGHPRNDVLFKKNKKPQFLGNNKFIFWAPTYRNSKLINSYNGGLISTIPIFRKEEYTELNSYLIKKQIKIMVKLHPIEDADDTSICEKSNLIIYNHKYFFEKGYEIYSLISNADALITDYSSIYFDYLLLDRPVAFTLDDIEKYKQNRGFVMDNPLDFMPGEKIFTKEEFYKFIDDIANGVDNYKKERERVNNIVNYYKDGNNCKRVLDISGIKQ